MDAPSWEQKTRRPLVRVVRWLIILLFISAVAGIIIYNNRDLISGSAVPANTIAAAHDSSGLFSPSRADRSGPLTSATTLTTVESIRGSGSDRPAVSVRPLETDGGRGFASVDSVALGEMVTPVPGRPEVKVHFTAMLYFGERRYRNVLLTRRDALSVMARSVVRSRDLATASDGLLRPEMVSALNAVLDTPVITDAVVRNISIEKVSR
jgi:hypothetical protein